MWPLIQIVGVGVALWKAVEYLDTPTAFISFAAEDANIRDLLVGQSKHPESPWRLRDRSLHEPFSSAWKTQTRQIIEDSDVVIMLVSPTTHLAEGAIWEVDCAIANEVPVFGLQISKHDKGRRPSCLDGQRVIEWTQVGLAREIRRAAKSRSRDWWNS